MPDAAFPLYLGALLFLIAGAAAVYAYNRLVTLKQRGLNAFAQIDVQLTRRHNLVPNLVETVKGAMKHERETLLAVVQARSRAIEALRMTPPSLLEQERLMHLAASENTLTATLSGLVARIEAYPELKAMRNTLQLMEELRSTENRIAFARQAYNDAVARYNSQRDSFPTLLVAGLLGFAPLHYLQFSCEPAN